MGQFHWQPERYLALMREEVPAYERLQDETAAAAAVDAVSVLELGTGTGETAIRVLGVNPRATLYGIDASAEMLAHAEARLPPARVTLRRRRLEDPLPAGPFDLVVSALTVHHLDGPAKADLFRRVADVLAPVGRLVVGDVVVPEDPADVITPIDGDYDQPSSVPDQLRWVEAAGLVARLAWHERDLAVIVGDRPG